MCSLISITVFEVFIISILSVVRHKEIGINSEGLRDKFRIHITEHGQKNVIGKM